MMFAAAQATVIAKSLGNRIDKAISFLPVIADHVTRLMGIPPDDDDDNPLRKHIRKALGNIQKEVSKMVGRTQQRWQDYVDDFFEWTRGRNPWTRPPPTPPAGG
jgi:hypothetical protein